MKKRRDDGGRADLTDEQWTKLKPLLPSQKAWTGKPAHDHRRIVDGILWVHRTGAPWRDILERYGNHRTISSWFYRWRKIGIWEQIWSSLLREALQVLHKPKSETGILEMVEVFHISACQKNNAFKPITG